MLRVAALLGVLTALLRVALLRILPPLLVTTLGVATLLGVLALLGVALLRGVTELATHRARRLLLARAHRKERAHTNQQHYYYTNDYVEHGVVI